MSQEYIIITDFRALPWFAAINMARRLSRRQKISFIVSARYLYSDDYGSHLPTLYKILKIKILCYFFKLIKVEAYSGTTINQLDATGIISSLQSITCDSKACEMTYPQLYKKLYESALGGKEIFNYICSSNHFTSKVYIFNGRTASSYPIVRGCFDQGIEVAYYEYASTSYSGYRLYPYPPHDTKRLGLDVIKFRKSCLKSKKEIYLGGVNWKHNKLNNSHVVNYKEKTNLKYDVVAFLGSDHEYTCLDEDITGFKFVGNLGFVKAVIDKYGLTHSIAVRAHPNQRNDINYRSTLDAIYKLCKDSGVDFFDPHSAISSYDLIKNSSIVAVEFSSIAYDAIFLGKKVYLFGDLDLKNILLQIPDKLRENTDYIASYVSEVMALYDDLFFIRFSRIEKFVCRAVGSFEYRVLRCSVPSKADM
jgi:hypothetical protein